METKRNYILLRDLEVYKLARELSRFGWGIYDALDWQTRKIMGDQFISATDSFGANIAEGYGRYHYLDKIKFFYNARASLMESAHWIELLAERNKVSKINFEHFVRVAKQSSKVHQSFITANYRAKDGN